MRLGANVVLRLMECLTPAFSFEISMDNYFTSFRLLSSLGVTNIQTTDVLYKNWLQKKTWPISTEHIKAKSSVTLIVVG